MSARVTPVRRRYRPFPISAEGATTTAIDERDLAEGPVRYSLTTRVRIGGYGGALEITGQSLNEVRKAVRLLPEAGIELRWGATA
ncbi:MAG TPA: hypothetical protein VLA19_14190 [Herpetosiphonaceae bacterium]|nr:hypothetical protein [Herpetosiphonaceae bacterium]